MSQITDQIKERIGVAELVSEYLRLERAGSNYKALCPFHNEKTPSFMVSPERNFWYCFGCRKGGDIFTFVMELEGLEFREALERLAEKAGVEIPRYFQENKEEKNQKRRVLDILEEATKFYQYQLKTHSRGTQAWQYLAARKLTPQQLEDFRIGFAPDGWRNVLEHLSKRGHKLADIAASGLLVAKDNQPNEYYDRFRDRIMFPVIDVNGSVVGYSARVMPGGDEKSAKYINTPQTIVYDKSQVLYGLYQARTEIKKNNELIIVEGNMDVISSHVAGVGNIVAVSGTALTPRQILMLKRYNENFKLCFDMDEAGQSATAKSIQLCLREGADVEVVTLPAGVKDVGDLVVNQPDLWPKVIKQSMPVMRYFFLSTFKRFDRQNVKDKKAIAQHLLNIIKDIADPIEQSYWLKKLSIGIEVDEEILTKVLERARMEKDTTPLSEQNAKEKKVNSKPKKIVLQQRLLGLFSLFPSELVSEAEQLDEGIFDPPLAAIWQRIKTRQPHEFEQELHEYELAVKFYYDEKEGFVENQIEPVKEWGRTLVNLRKLILLDKLKQLEWDIQRAKERHDKEAEELMAIESAKLKIELNELG